MSKTFESKKKILDLLTHGARTPTDISRQIGLSPSTVSQHLKELKETGRIEEFQDEHFRNIRYYRRVQNAPIISSNSAKFAAGALAIAILAVLVISFAGHSAFATAPANQTSNVGIFITDPPQVPSETQSLIVSYSSLKVQVTNNSGTFWETINGSGSVDLLSLVNFTKNLSTFKLANNSVIDRLSLTIYNASITVNGTTYPVVISNKNVSVKVFYNSQSSTPFDILLDMFPTVSAVISGNQTIFVMAPSATASTIVKKDNPYYQNEKSGQPVRLNYQEEQALDQSRPKISISNASISTSGNQSNISIEVADDSNQSTSILGVVILGNESYELNLNFSNSGTIIMPNPRIPYNATNPSPNATGWQNWRDAGSHSNYTPSGAYGDRILNISMRFNGSHQVYPGNYQTVKNNFGSNQVGTGNLVQSKGVNFRIWVNGSSMSYLMNNLSNVTVKGKMDWIMKSGGLDNVSLNFTGNVVSGRIVGDIRSANYIQSRLENFKSLNLFVAQNGTLLLPMQGIMHESESKYHALQFIGPYTGYNLSAGGIATLKYTGSLSLANGQFDIQFKPGQTYRIIVIGSGGAEAMTNVTAN